MNPVRPHATSGQYLAPKPIFINKKFNIHIDIKV